jgi:uncharacterized integral membrane protein
MGFLKVLRNILLLVVVIGFIGFAVLNPGQRLEVDLWLFGRWVDVPLVEIVFLAFVLGIAVGLAFMVVSVLELRTRLRQAKRSGSRLETELTSLRNLPLEEPEDTDTATAPLMRSDS